MTSDFQTRIRTFVEFVSVLLTDLVLAVFLELDHLAVFPVLVCLVLPVFDSHSKRPFEKCHLLDMRFLICFLLAFVIFIMLVSLVMVS